MTHETVRVSSGCIKACDTKKKKIVWRQVRHEKEKDSMEPVMISDTFALAYFLVMGCKEEL